MKDKPEDILEENRLDNIARTKEHNWDPDKPARKKPKLFVRCHARSGLVMWHRKPKTEEEVKRLSYDEQSCWVIIANTSNKEIMRRYERARKR